MISAQASVGNAATSPTSGTILMPADAIRHGAANTPQPLRGAASASTIRSRFTSVPDIDIAARTYRTVTLPAASLARVRAVSTSAS